MGIDLHWRRHAKHFRLLEACDVPKSRAPHIRREDSHADQKEELSQDTDMENICVQLEAKGIGTEHVRTDFNKFEETPNEAVIVERSGFPLLEVGTKQVPVEEAMLQLSEEE